MLGREGAALGVPGAGVHDRPFSKSAKRFSKLSSFDSWRGMVSETLSKSFLVATPSWCVTLRNAASMATAKALLSMFAWRRPPSEASHILPVTGPRQGNRSGRGCDRGGGCGAAIHTMRLPTRRARRCADT